MPVTQNWWAEETRSLLTQLASSEQGLSTEQASGRSSGHAAPSARGQALRLLLAQFTSPLVLILVVAAVLTLVLRFLTLWLPLLPGAIQLRRFARQE